MNKFIAIAFLGLQFAAISGAQAVVGGPDQIYTDVSCHNLSGLTGGLSVQIKSGGFAGLTWAELTNRDGLGPFVNLGQITVHQVPAQPGVDGAPLVYQGEGFELSINVDGAPTPQGQYSHVYADIHGRVFNEPMYCELMAHPM